MQLNGLTRAIRDRAWGLLNNLRRSHPRPRRAMPFDETVSEEGVQLLWQGPPPPAQTIRHAQPALNVGRLAFWPPAVLALRHGSVIGKRGDVVTAQGTVFTNVSPEIPRRPHHHFLLERGNLPQSQYIAGAVAVLNCGPYRNYFHFMFDAISRLHFYRQAKVRVSYYCVAYRLPFQRELLALFGIHEHQVIPLQKGTHLVARSLVVATLPGYNRISAQVHLKDQGTYHFVRTAVLAQLSAATGRYAERIYVQRRGKRSLVNETEVLRELQQTGEWKVVRLEEHTVLEQAAIFYRARQIVAPHGAGLANLVYAQPGARVVEIFSASLVEPVYLQLATLFGLRYRPVIGEPFESDFDSLPEQAERIKVDPKQVRQGLLA